MTRDKQLKVWVDSLEAARLSVRAEAAGTTVSQYIGALIARDGEEARRRSRLDALAGELLELTYLNAILVRELLARGMGGAAVDSLVTRAQEKAHKAVQARLADLEAKPDEGEDRG